jgi:hypothetical protein
MAKKSKAYDDEFGPRPKPGFHGSRGRDPDEAFYWGPKTPAGFKDFQPWNKSAAMKKTISDLRKWQQDQYKDDKVLGIKGKNPVRTDRAASTLNRLTDYNKVLGRLRNADARRGRNTATKAAAAKAALAKRNERKK